MKEKPSTTPVQNDSPKVLLHTLSVEEASKLLDTDTNNGLSESEVEKRLLQHGNNTLKGEGGISPWKILLRQFTNIMVFILLAATVLSFVVKDFGEGAVLVIIIVLNAAVGFFQEYRAEKTVDSLRKLTSPTSRAMRQGHLELVPTMNLVPGDILFFESGDVVGADCRLFDILNFETDEALLTGEALPVLKTSEEIPDPDTPLGDRINIGYSSTFVTKGRAKGMVFATGMSSEVGKIATKLMETSDTGKTKLNKSLDKLSYYCLGLAIIFVVVVFGVNKFKINNEVAIYAISLAIAVIPEGLLAVLTLTMALGVRQMSKQKALVRQLNSLEVLGSVTDICSDKTGTLTQSKMVLVRGWLPEEGEFRVTGLGFEPVGEIHKTVVKDGATNPDGEDSMISVHISNDQLSTQFKKLAAISAICNMSEIKQEADSGEWYGVGDPTEIALQVFANKLGYGKQTLEKGEDAWVTECEFSFDSSIKRMTVIARDRKKLRVAFMKGATERIADACDRIMIGGEVRPITPTDLISYVDPKITELATDGLRVISLAYRDVRDDEFPGPTETWDRETAERNMIYIGMVGIYDPPRPESKLSVEKCFGAGIMVHMLTGDHPATAKAIARQIGIIADSEPMIDESGEQIKVNSLVMTATQFDALSDEEIDQMPELPSVIARCTPDTKVKLIQALHRRNGIVAMTGDGVNDSPSLKFSDVGIAMGMTGSDVAKQAASIILTDDNFSTIVRAIAEGRRLFTNIGKFVRVLTGANVAELVCLVVGLAYRDGSGNSIFPLSPVAILANNLLTGTPPAMAIGTELAPKDNMNNPPRDPRKGLFTVEVISDIAAHGLFIGLVSILGFHLRLEVFGDGNLGVDCNTKYNDSCSTVFKARGVNFANLTILLMFFAYSCRTPREQTLSAENLKRIYSNRYLFYSFWSGIIVTILALYIPGLNTGIFKHSPIDYEWGIIAVSIVVYLSYDALYKYVKKFIFKPAYLNSEKELNLQKIATVMSRVN